MWFSDPVPEIIDPMTADGDFPAPSAALQSDLGLILRQHGCVLPHRGDVPVGNDAGFPARVTHVLLLPVRDFADPAWGSPEERVAQDTAWRRAPLLAGPAFSCRPDAARSARSATRTPSLTSWLWRTQSLQILCLFHFTFGFKRTDLRSSEHKASGVLYKRSPRPAIPDLITAPHVPHPHSSTLLNYE